SEIKAAFELFDKDGSGFIDSAELKAVLHSLKQNPTDADVQAMIDELDTNKNGQIDYAEFEKYMAGKFKDPNEVEDEMQAAFKVFDKDGSGKIDAEELKTAMMNLGERMSDKDVNEMIAAADLDSDGKVDYKEFVKIMMK
ncbi:uncharacterized protein LOC133182517, partial [Saccostrea echinata]|uniref:uncharacterized protein LOC133182517 n=1 Tax=Saccostrea echinata TaxID=191078 RepID=UPI002A7FB097